MVSWGICLYIHGQEHHEPGSSILLMEEEEVHWYLWLTPGCSLWQRRLEHAACHHVGAGSISPEKDGALLGQTAKRFHPPTSWVSTLSRRWEWVWTSKNVEKGTQLCQYLLEPKLELDAE